MTYTVVARVQNDNHKHIYQNDDCCKPDLWAKQVPDSMIGRNFAVASARAGDFAKQMILLMAQ